MTAEDRFAQLPARRSKFFDTKFDWLKPLWNEPIIASLILVSILPVLVAVSILVKLGSRGPILYSQRRVGFNGKEFSIYKFRSMKMDAEASSGPILAIKNDNRITKVGRFLRASHLDELPQIWNVINGDMAFLGPRPERMVFVNRYVKEIVNYNYRHSVKPGVTGLAQVCLPYDAKANDKLHYDLHYIGNKGSLNLNLFIIWKTFQKVIKAF